jgi:hypothetical protein
VIEPMRRGKRVRKREQGPEPENPRGNASVQ